MEKMKERKDMYEKTVKDYIEKVTTPIFNKVLQETRKNRISVGSRKTISYEYSLFNPHNYRLFFDFKKDDFHPLRPSKPTYQTDGGRLGLRNSKEWVTKEKLLGCDIIIKKTQAQVNNLNEPKRWYLIQMGDIDKRKQQVYEIHQKKINEGIMALKSFLEAYGGVSKLNLLRIWCEEKVQGDKQIDKVPIKMIFKAKNVKKNYQENNVEYFGDPIGAANYFSNRGIEDVAPSIAQSLDTMNNAVNKFGAMLTGNLNMMAMLNNMNIAVTKLRMEVNRTKRTPKNHNKDLRKWI